MNDAMPLSPPAKIPDWLRNAYTSSHLELVLTTLRDRESKRVHARSSCKKQAKSSTSSAAKKLSSIVPKRLTRSDNVDHYSISAGLAHKDKNRYLDVEPYDRTRVVIGEKNHGITTGLDQAGHAPFDEEGRYLNANWVLEGSGGKWWIATQAPLPHTAHAFLSVILQPISRPPTSLLTPHTAESSHKPCRVRTVVQLTQNVESGRLKAHAYFPSDVGRSLIIPPERGYSSEALKVTLMDLQSFDEAQCIRSSVSVVPIKNPNELKAATAFDENIEINDAEEDEDIYGQEVTEERVVFQHMLYTAWPDHGIPEPEDRASLLSFVKLVNETNRDTSLYPPSVAEQLHPDPPMMVGCSAGIGRTGSFIALSSLLRSLQFLPPPEDPTPTSVLPPSPLGPLPKEVQEDHIAAEVDELREQRPGMVQREEQILLIYEVLLSAFLATK